MNHAPLLRVSFFLAAGLLSSALPGTGSPVTAGQPLQEKAPPPAPAPPPAVDAGKSKYPLPAAAKDPSVLGKGIQRTMTLLATSTPQNRNKVRILFYGQSITEQDWSKRVADDLRRRFPHADLEIENRAIGGFASQLLIRPAEHDLYPFYPDLVIFHVYGSNGEYEQIIKNARSRTTTEILMQKDHATFWPPAVIDQNKDKGAWWDNLMNHSILPDIAKKYGAGLVDIRRGWLDYLRANSLEPKALLSDSVHLNDHGNFLMAELVKQYLVHRPDLASSDGNTLVRTVPVGKGGSPWKNGKIVLEFEGNRVDLIAAATPAKGKKASTARVLIDGKKPSQFSEAYRITRPRPNPWSPLALARVDHDAPLIVEDWTLKITSVGPDSRTWMYDVTGSITGPDGSGTSDAPFTSKSGRVRIGSDAFFRNGNVPSDYEIKWQVLPMHRDTYASGAAAASPASGEPSVTVAQGIPNGRHRLEIIADDPKNPPSLRALRVYRPPVK